MSALAAAAVSDGISMMRAHLRAPRATRSRARAVPVAPTTPSDGGLCESGQVVTDAPTSHLTDGGVTFGVLSLYVACAARRSGALTTVVDQIGVVSGPLGVYRLFTYPKSIPEAPSNANAAAALGIAPGAALSASLDACGDSPGAALVAADVQCHGVPNDRCACVGNGSVRCVTAGAAATVTLPDFVARRDLDSAAPMPWCEDGDMLDGWLLLQVRARRDCASHDLAAQALFLCRGPASSCPRVDLFCALALALVPATRRRNELAR